METERQGGAWESQADAVFSMTMLATGEVVATVGQAFTPDHGKLFKAAVETLHDLGQRM